MRMHPAVFIGLALSLLTAGCTSSGVDALDIAPRPSAEITASVGDARTETDTMTTAGTESGAPAPAAPVPNAMSARTLRQSLADPDPDPAPRPGSVQEEQEQATPLAQDMPAGAADEPLALAATPPVPAMKPMERQQQDEDLFAEEPPAPRGGAVHSPKFRDAKPVKFSRGESPKPFEVHGVDVSRWQGRIDWAKLRRQGANFAFIKATDGGDHLDPMFRRNWKSAAEAGVPRGAYHFFYWCRNAESQAKWFIRNVPREAGALPPVIDVEWNGQSRCRRKLSRERVLEKMTVFMDMLERHYGQRPIIYTAPDFYRDNLRGAFPNHPFWLRAVADHPSDVYPGREWAFWQYSGTGLSKGVAGRIDLNVFNGTAESWNRWLARATRG